MHVGAGGHHLKVKQNKLGLLAVPARGRLNTGDGFSFSLGHRLRDAGPKPEQPSGKGEGGWGFFSTVLDCLATAHSS